MIDVANTCYNIGALATGPSMREAILVRRLTGSAPLWRFLVVIPCIRRTNSGIPVLVFVGSERRLETGDKSHLVLTIGPRIENGGNLNTAIDLGAVECLTLLAFVAAALFMWD
ncbi:hypothetical protein RRG08_030234 [Elysia crispata]|uniref:Uncharacterized protein n=1 Tax=Elysia crispata TaxID=231223 RepID=A0AAE1E0N5_9GAST|nr:hypothetical protein RRG08_030234 [Elysia crispata]